MSGMSYGMRLTEQKHFQEALPVQPARSHRSSVHDVPLCLKTCLWILQGHPAGRSLHPRSLHSEDG